MEHAERLSGHTAALLTARRRRWRQGEALLELTGRLMGKALWDGVLLDAALAPFFVHKLTGQHSYLEELPQLDAVLYQSLMQLKRYEGDVTDLCLDFTVRDFTLPPRTHTHTHTEPVYPRQSQSRIPLGHIGCLLQV